jgi:hypothetical protein
MRYRALTRASYALALGALADLSRARPDPPFEFGPMSLTGMERNGLTVVSDDLAKAQEALKAVPGLIEVPA